MFHPKAFAALFFAPFCLGLCLGLAGPAHAQTRHFQTSQSHFENIAAQAAALSGQVDIPSQKNICNYYAATAVTYAVRAHALAQLADIAAKAQNSGDKSLVLAKMAETGAYVTRPVENDLKLLENLSAASPNSRVRELGLHLANEVRVFAHNAQSVSAQ